MNKIEIYQVNNNLAFRVWEGGYLTRNGSIEDVADLASLYSVLEEGWTVECYALEPVEAAGLLARSDACDRDIRYASVVYNLACTGDAYQGEGSSGYWVTDFMRGISEGL